MGNKAGGKVVWEVTVELGTMGLRKGTNNQRHHLWEEEGGKPNSLFSAPETLAGGREVGERGYSLGRSESDYSALNTRVNRTQRCPHLGHIHSRGPFLFF